MSSTQRDIDPTTQPDGTDGQSAPSRWTQLATKASRVHSDLALILLDVVLVATAYVVMLVLRFEALVPDRFFAGLWSYLPLLVFIHLATNWATGLYGPMWRHASVLEARRVLMAGAISGLAVTSILLFLSRPLPISVGLLGAVSATMLMGMQRFQSRLFALRRNRNPAERVIVVGAGESGAALLREMHRSHDSGMTPVALLDDDPRKQGRTIGGVRVEGSTHRVVEAANRYEARQVLLAIPSADSELVRRLADQAAAVGLKLKVLPSVAELLGDQVSVRDVRDLSISDLLGRRQVKTDLDSVRSIIEGRRVLVTGAGGSIGSEIARQVAAFAPARLALLDHDETHLFDTAAAIADSSVVQVLADVRDDELVLDVFRREQPHIVFHAAAHKHVPLLEAYPSEAVSTNILGTLNVVRAAKDVDVERFVFISTDKAVNPTSVMGASKRLGEQIVLNEAPWDRRYCAVRFGNVLGSRGSVVPTFMRQIRAGGPVTLTDPEMTRFFMSVEEAVQLVLQASALAHSREVFMLDMGEPVRILDLAHRMISLAGYRVGVDVEIQITGRRPGEKLFEELYTQDEELFPTPHTSILSLFPATLSPEELSSGLRRLAKYAGRRDDAATTELLFDLATRPGSVLRLPGSDTEATRAGNGDAVVGHRASRRAERVGDRSTASAR